MALEARDISLLLLLLLLLSEVHNIGSQLCPSVRPSAGLSPCEWRAGSKSLEASENLLCILVAVVV